MDYLIEYWFFKKSEFTAELVDILVSMAVWVSSIASKDPASYKI
jgi:hypothetical protein